MPHNLDHSQYFSSYMSQELTFLILQISVWHYFFGHQGWSIHYTYIQIYRRIEFSIKNLNLQLKNIQHHRKMSYPLIKMQSNTFVCPSIKRIFYSQSAKIG